LTGTGILSYIDFMDFLKLSFIYLTDSLNTVLYRLDWYLITVLCGLDEYFDTVLFPTLKIHMVSETGSVSFFS